MLLITWYNSIGQITNQELKFLLTGSVNESVDIPNPDP